MNRYVWLAAALASLSCHVGRAPEATSREAPSQSSAATEVGPPTSLPPAGLPEAWEAFGGDGVDPMCLFLRPDGSLQFLNGFQFLNPGGWSYDSSTMELTLVLPALPFDTVSREGYEYRLERSPLSHLKSFDSATHTLRYAVGPDPAVAQFDFEGWYFFAPGYFRATKTQPWINCDSIARERPGT